MAVDNEEAQARRRRAEQLQQDAVLQDAFYGIEAHWLNEWRGSAVERREEGNRIQDDQIVRRIPDSTSEHGGYREIV